MDQTRSERGSASCLDPVGDTQAPKRTATGRFATGHSGNPNGRPPRPREDLGLLLRRLLDEKVPTRSSGGQTEMSIAEALFRRALGKAMEDPRLIFPLLKLLSGHSSEGQSGSTLESHSAGTHEAILDSYVEREIRKRAASAAAEHSTGENIFADARGGDR